MFSSFILGDTLNVKSSNNSVNSPFSFISVCISFTISSFCMLVFKFEIYCTILSLKKIPFSLLSLSLYLKNSFFETSMSYTGLIYTIAKTLSNCV